MRNRTKGGSFRKVENHCARVSSCGPFVGLEADSLVWEGTKADWEGAVSVKEVEDGCTP